MHITNPNIYLFSLEMKPEAFHQRERDDGTRNLLQIYRTEIFWLLQFINSLLGVMLSLVVRTAESLTASLAMNTGYKQP